VTNEEKSLLKKLIVATSSYYNRQINDDAIKMYVNDLADLSFEKVCEAMDEYRKNSNHRFMWLPAQIREIVSPTPKTKDVARMAALQIRSAITKFGWSNPTQAKEFIGPRGWEYVERFGGWVYLCENLGVTLSETTFFAQFRDSVESGENLRQMDFDATLPALEQFDEFESLEDVSHLRLTHLDT
jgi:hypothetical protein